ncbi:AraC family transcriptional regulator [Clostridioides difficile]|nr:AraC family transcriptional regulator [Clostridioides difficile]VIG52432.1 AraC family transcriptional regulator [Clostridioides difficile]
MFSYIAEVPVSEYIRRRRMTKAAFELQNSNIKILELSEKYGYDSPTSFNRAFQNIHNISPSAARAKGVVLKAYPKMTLSIYVKGNVEMQYRIVEKKGFRIVGIKESMNMIVEECFEKVPKLWAKCIKNGTIDKLSELINNEPCGLLGVSVCTNSKGLDYYIAAPTDKPILEDTHEYLIPSGTWAVFECVSPMPNALAIQELQKRIITEWLPSSGYVYSNLPDIELYPNGDINSPDYTTEVWIPIQKPS